VDKARRLGAAQRNQVTSMDQSAGPGAEDIGCRAGRTAMTLSEYSFVL
jgi:hypothetical protein